MKIARAERGLLIALVMMCVTLGAGPVRADDASQGIPSESALKAKIALKLAGLVTFVAASCPNLKADYPRFKTTVAALGLSYADLSKTDMKNTYLGYALRYKESEKENCIRARDQFGPGGKIVPNIFAVVDAQRDQRSFDTR